LLADPETIVRRNAALALVRFNDASGRGELLAILQPFTLIAPAAGVLQSSLSSGAQISRGALLGRILEPNNEVIELRSPLIGKVDRLLVASGASLENGAAVLTIKSDEQSIWETLRALAVVGQPEDLGLMENYISGAEPVSERLKQQATLTANAIKQRAVEKN
jgi:hypothetical protein